LLDGFCALGEGFADLGEGFASIFGSRGSARPYDYYTRNMYKRLNRDLVGYGMRPIVDTSGMSASEALAADRAALAGDYEVVLSDMRKAWAGVAAERGLDVDSPPFDLSARFPREWPSD
jgi:hypothetical protein